jgi:hypothetical protein
LQLQGRESDRSRPGFDTCSSPLARVSRAMPSTCLPGDPLVIEVGPDAALVSSADAALSLRAILQSRASLGMLQAAGQASARIPCSDGGPAMARRDLSRTKCSARSQRGATSSIEFRNYRDDSIAHRFTRTCNNLKILLPRRGATVPPRSSMTLELT